MWLRNLIFYTVLGGFLWTITLKLGGGLGIALAASLLVPPLLMLVYTLYKHRGPLL